MRVPPILSVRDAALSLIRGVPEVMTWCAGRVYDQVPATGALPQVPFVACGPAAMTRYENGDDGLKSLRLRLFFVSEKPTRDDAWTMAQAAADALEGVQPDISGGFRLIDSFRVQNMGDTLDKISPSEVFVDITTTAQSN